MLSGDVLVKEESGKSNYKRWFFLVLVVILIVELLHVLGSDAESKLLSSLFEVLAALTLLGFSIKFASFVFRKNSMGSYIIRSQGVRRIALITVVVGIFLVIMAIIFPVR